MKRILAVCLIMTLVVTGCVRPGEPGSSSTNPININLNGATLKFLDASAIPDITGNASKLLTNNGTDILWSTLAINATGNVSVWGDIGGDITDQADLYAFLVALNATARIDTLNATVVNNSGNITTLNNTLATLNGSFVTLNGTVVTLNQTLVNLSGNFTGANSTLNAHIADASLHVPSQVGQAGRYLTTNGTVTSWATPPGGGNVSVWGDIGGTLANQLDLQAALDAKGSGNVTGPIADIETWLNSKQRTYNATAMTVNKGTLTVGSVTLLKTQGDNTTIQEANGADPLTVSINFSSVATFPTSLLWLGSYNGTHSIAVQIWDYDTSDWDTLATMTQETTNEWYISPILPSNYNSGNITQIRFYHADNGVASHYLTIDYIVLQQTLAIGGGAHDAHTHSNKTILDAITESFTTALKNSYDAVVTWLTALRQAYVDYVPTLNTTVNNHVGNATPHIPDMTSNAGKVLTNNGTAAIWATNGTGSGLPTSNVSVLAGADKTPSANQSGKLDGSWFSPFGMIPLFGPNTTVTTGNNTKVLFWPEHVNGWNVTAVWAGVSTNSSSGNVTVNIYNVRLGAYILTTALSIDGNEGTSYTAVTPYVLSTNLTGIQTGDQYRFDVIYSGTGAQGLQVGIVIGKS